MSGNIVKRQGQPMRQCAFQGFQGFQGLPGLDSGFLFWQLHLACWTDLLFPASANVPRTSGTYTRVPTLGYILYLPERTLLSLVSWAALHLLSLALVIHLNLLYLPSVQYLPSILHDGRRACEFLHRSSSKPLGKAALSHMANQSTWLEFQPCPYLLLLQLTIRVL